MLLPWLRSRECRDILFYVCIRIEMYKNESHNVWPTDSHTNTRPGTNLNHWLSNLNDCLWLKNMIFKRMAVTRPDYKYTERDYRRKHCHHWGFMTSATYVVHTSVRDYVWWPAESADWLKQMTAGVQSLSLRSLLS